MIGPSPNERRIAFAVQDFYEQNTTFPSKEQERDMLVEYVYDRTNINMSYKDVMYFTRNT